MTLEDLALFHSNVRKYPVIALIMVKLTLIMLMQLFALLDSSLTLELRYMNTVYLCSPTSCSWKGLLGKGEKLKTPSPPSTHLS